MAHESSMANTSERVKRVISDIKILLEGCSRAEEVIEVVLDEFEWSFCGGETHIVHDKVATLVIGLSECSIDCFSAKSTEDVVRVEVIIRMLFSTLQKFQDPFDVLAHLEKLSQEPDNLKAEFLDYGYQGIKVTETGKLQVTVSELLRCGESVLHDAIALEPSLVDEMIRFWFWGHWLRIAECLVTLGMYTESLPWFEASLKVLSLVSNYPAALSESSIGTTLLEISDECADPVEKEEMARRAVTHMEKSIHFFGAFFAEDDPRAAIASKTIWPRAVVLEKEEVTAGATSTIAQLYVNIGHTAKDVLMDFRLSLHNFAKGAETYAAVSDYLSESVVWFKYGDMVLKHMPDKLEEARLHLRRSLEAGLKVNPRTSEAQSAIHNAYMPLKDIIFQLVPSTEYLRLDFPCLSDYRYRWIPPLMNDYPPSWTIARARAEYLLGLDYVCQRMYEEAITMLLHGLATLEEEPPTDETGHYWLRLLPATIHAYLGRLYLLPVVGKYKEAAKHFNLSGQFLDDPKSKITVSLYEANALCLCGEYGTAMDVVKGQLLQGWTESDLVCLRSGLMACKGYLEHWMGDFDESILSLEEARTMYQGNKDFECQDLAYVHMVLVENYLWKNDYWAASNVVKTFQPVIDKYHKGGSLWHIWQVIKAKGHQIVGDVQEANRVFDQLEALQLPVGKREILLETGVRAAVYRVENDLESAMEQYAIEEEKVSEVSNTTQIRFAGIGFTPKVALAVIALNRAATLLRDADNTEHLEESVKESQRAAAIFRKELGQSVKLARALACQAAGLFNLDPIRHSKQCIALIDEAIQLVKSRDRLLVAKCKHIKALILEANDPLSAEAEGREAALIFGELQLQLKDMESAWVTMFGSDMRHQFLFMETLTLRVPLKALLWAERGRMRLFVYNTKQRVTLDLLTPKPTIDCDSLDKSDGVADVVEEPADEFQGLGHILCSEAVECVERGVDENLSCLDELSFDRDDVLAEKHLLQTVIECGPGALILEYTFAHDHEVMYVYAVFIDDSGQHIVVECESVFDLMNEKLREKREWGKTLTTVIHQTREFIAKKRDEDAIEGLSLLYSLLIEPVQKYVKRCQKLILATHEQLALIPFAALYDKGSGKFLIQEKIVSYIPSIRVLHHCYCRQQEFERDMLKGQLGAPFVAGNPEPMGWGQPQLHFAAEEAQVVAQILGVKSYTGPEVNKEAVKDGLSNGSMVLLATHGLVNTYFPHGALILKGRGTSPPQDESNSVMNRGCFFERMRSTSSFQVDDSADAAISSDEIASLPRGIRAGLVVLSACKSGQGEVTSEGLLGLGRALLQGGAASAVLTLWAVNDASTNVLISGMFEQLVTRGKDVAQALQHTMLQMMEDNKTYKINHWAPMMVFGSPLFRYINPPKKGIS